MLFVLFVIFLIIGISLLYIDDNYYGLFEYKEKDYPMMRKLYNLDVFTWVGGITTIICGFCIAISLFIICGQYMKADAFVETSKETYKALCYKVESESIRDELGLLNKAIVDEIQEWNEDVVAYQELQNDFWLGIYYPNIYDQFETIELK